MYILIDQPRDEHVTHRAPLFKHFVLASDKIHELRSYLRSNHPNFNHDSGKKTSIKFFMLNVFYMVEDLSIFPFFWKYFILRNRCTISSTQIWLFRMEIVRLMMTMINQKDTLTHTHVFLGEMGKA